MARSMSSRAKSTCCSEALTLRSISGWTSAKLPSRWTSHFAAKFGDVLTVSTPPPPAWRCRQPLCAGSDAVKSVAHDDKIGAASFGNDEALPFAIEQLQSELRLERPHLMADGTLGDAEFLRR